MAYTASDLTKVQTAIIALADGSRVVNGKTIQYGQAQMKELQALRDSIQVEIGAAFGTMRRFVLPATGKGLRIGMQ